MSFLPTCITVVKHVEPLASNAVLAGLPAWFEAQLAILHAVTLVGITQVDFTDR